MIDLIHDDLLRKPFGDFFLPIRNDVHPSLISCQKKKERRREVSAYGHLPLITKAKQKRRRFKLTFISPYCVK